jgi:small subunit ribosomal protein S17
MAKKKDEMTESDPAKQPLDAEAAAAEVVAEEAPVEPEPEVVVEAVAEEAPVEPEPEVVVEAVAEEAPVEPEPEVEAVADEAPVEPKAAAEPAPAAAPAPAPQSGPKPKKKRLPRLLRQAKTRAKREKPAERKPIVRLEKPERERGRTTERQGTVVSSAMDKTIVVKVDVIKSHPKYKKVVRRSTKFHVHDEGNTAKVGDVVRIVETRPLSKTKRWRLAEIVEVAK